MRRIVLATCLTTVVSIALLACGDKGETGTTTTAPPDEELVHGLTEAQAAEVLVQIGDETITVGEFANKLADQSPYLRARYNSPERRREFLNNMIRFEVLAQEAQRRGLHDLPDIARTRKQAMTQQMMKEMFENRIRLSDVTDEEVTAFYEAHRDEFNKPEQVRASQIRFTSRATAQRVLRQLKANESDVALFRRLAEQHNTDEATRENLGDLRFFSREGEGDPAESASVPAPIREAAFGIPRIGGVHGELVEIDGAFYIVKLTGRRAAIRRTLDEARRPIQNRLWREKRETAIETFVAELRGAADVEVNESALQSVHVNVPDSAPGPEVQVLDRGTR